MDGLEALGQIFQAVDGFAAVAVSVWIISLGFKQTQANQVMMQEFIEETMRQHKETNNSLMQLVRDLTAIRYPFDHKSGGLD